MPTIYASTLLSGAVSNVASVGMKELRRALGRSPLPTVADPSVLEHAGEYVKGEQRERLGQPDPWAALSMLWPPRLIGALVERKVAAFFGAGMSLAAGAPPWGKLLTEYFRLEDDIIQDRELGDDPLTLAQLAAERVGYERVQQILRETMGDYAQPTAGHVLLAAMKLPIYITTNYDDLFEKAWRDVFPGIDLAVLTNDLNVPSSRDVMGRISSGETVLLKIHGCVKRTQEQLILTRRDYRTHYRANERFFDLVRAVLEKYHTLFLGFSHKDPEVSRLVEDVIYEYEKGLRSGEKTAAQAPHFYSLQFDMRKHIPEVFAARGLVALRPPPVPAKAGDTRSIGLATALCDLASSAEENVQGPASLDGLMRTCLESIAHDVNRTLDTLKAFADPAIATTHRREGSGWLQDVVSRCGSSLAGQGVWLLDHEGDVLDFELPSTGLKKDERKRMLAKRAPSSKQPSSGSSLGWLGDRPYFRAAKTFRTPFVSDVSPSIFNGHGTVFLCLPLMENEAFRGLLFAVAQPGAWTTPVDLAERCLRKQRQLILVDSNGVLLVPTIGDHNDAIAPIRSNGAGDLEEPEGNVGFPYERLLELSRRDTLVSHVTKNIVPVSQDDDMFELAPDLTQYSVIAEVPRSRLKLAVTRGIQQTRARPTEPTPQPA